MAVTTESKKETLSPLKAFKASKDLVDCYRFIHEKDLRREALMIIKYVLDQSPSTKSKSTKKTSRNKKLQ